MLLSELEHYENKDKKIPVILGKITGG